MTARCFPFNLRGVRAMNDLPSCAVRAVAVGLLFGLMATPNGNAVSQESLPPPDASQGFPPPDPNQGFPPPPPDPNQGFLPPPPNPNQGFSPSSVKVDLKQIFASTLAVAAASTGTAIVNSLVGALTGGIATWFSAKKQDRDRRTSKNSPIPLSSSSPAPNAEFPRTGSSLQLSAQSVDVVAAGLAFEVHAVFPDGRSVTVDTASHGFATGDRFVVFYRPTLPGKLEVFNINPLGQQTLIETLDLAGGELAQMGPYEFVNTSGEERLRLLMHPCTTPALLASTRDIVKAGTGDSMASPAPLPALRLPVCGTSGRSVQVRTRDIKKVENDGTIAFALDPLSPSELESGVIDSRELTIIFKHQ